LYIIKSRLFLPKIKLLNITKKSIMRSFMILKKPLFLLFFSILLLMVSCKKEIYKTPTVDLKAEISVMGESLVIINNDTFSYEDASIQLNRNYEIRDLEIKPGQTKTIKLFEFAGNQVKTLPEELKNIREITLFCTIPIEKKPYTRAMYAKYGVKYIKF